MNLRRIYIVIFLVSVVGLAFIQYQYLRIGLNLAKVQFDTKIEKVAENIKNDLSVRNKLTFLVGKAITGDESYFTMSLDSLNSASRYFLKQFLADQLHEAGIKADFDYVLHASDTLEYLSSSGAGANGNRLKYPMRLDGYLPELVQKGLVLELQFPDVNNYFLFQLNGLIIPGLIFIAAIVFVVIWVLRSFYWQQNIITTTNDFINNLTHELKTPVFSIGLATKMLEEKGTSETRPYTEVIREQNEKLKIHIDKVLDLAKLEKGRKAIELKEYDFYPVLLRLCEEFKRICDIENVDFNYDLHGNPYNIVCEPVHLQNAIGNLLENAKKYTEVDPVVRLKAFISKGSLFIEVSDEGIGMDEKELKRIFKKFYRVSSGDLHGVKGYGLGLSYSKQVMDAHNGEIKIKSTKGKGTRAIIKLPISKNGKRKITAG